MIKTYNGNDIFKNFNGGLYQYDDIDFEQSKNDILTAFKSEYKDIITEKLAFAGVKYIDMVYFSPSQYNYLNDSIDLKLTISDKSDIQKLLNDNKSYDGYISLTPDDISEIENDDITVIQSILSDIDFSDFDVTDYFTYDQEDN